MVARKLLPKAPASVYKLLVGYAGSQAEHHLDALVDAITEAKENARTQGRSTVAFSDVEAALTGTVSKAQLAKNALFASPGHARKGRLQHSRAGSAVPLQTDFADSSADPQNGLEPALQRAELVPV